MERVPFTISPYEFGASGCYCKTEGAHSRPIYKGGHCQQGTIEPGWYKHGFLCSKGHGHEENDHKWTQHFGILRTSKQIDIASSAADLYLLEAMAYDVANPRPFTVTDVDGFNFSQVGSKELLKLIGVSGPKKVADFIEKHGEGADTSAALQAQYEKWKHILAPNVPLDRSLVGIKEEANDLLQEHVTSLAALLRQYGHFSNCSELAYHYRFSEAFDCDVGLSNACKGWSDLINHVGGAEAARIGAELFRDKTKGNKKAWGSSYGGGKWAIAADVLSYFEDGFVTTKKKSMGPLTLVGGGKKGKPFGAKMFCDRMFALQHNTGSILTKVAWGYGRGTDAGYEVNGMIPLLDAHHNSDWYRLQQACSVEVLELFQAYWTVTNRELVRSGLEPVRYPYVSPVYTQGVNKPNTMIAQENPEPSKKANIVVIGGRKFEIPEHLIAAGKGVVYN